MTSPVRSPETYSKVATPRPAALAQNTAGSGARGCRSSSRKSDLPIAGRVTDGPVHSTGTEDPLVRSLIQEIVVLCFLKNSFDNLAPEVLSSKSKSRHYEEG